MNSNKLMKGLSVLCMVMAGLMISTGKMLFAFIFIIIGGAILFTVTDFNKAATSMYHQRVNAPDVSLNTLFGHLKKMNTPFGRCWMGEHTEKDKDSPAIIFGPDPFKNYVVIYKNGDVFDIKMGSDLRTLKAKNSHDITRNVLDVDSMEVTPASYSSFAGRCVVTKVFLDDITAIVEGIACGDKNVPLSLGSYTLYHYDSSDHIVRDLDKSEYAHVRTIFNPLEITVSDMDGDEVVHLLAKEKTPPRRLPRKGCDISVSGEMYGTIKKADKEKRDVYLFDTEDGLFTVTAFPAMRIANISCNYKIELDGVRKAIVAGMVRLDFDKEGTVQNGVIMSLDDKYLPIYIMVEEFIMGTNRFIR